MGTCNTKKEEALNNCLKLYQDMFNNNPTGLLDNDYFDGFINSNDVYEILKEVTDYFICGYFFDVWTIKQDMRRKIKENISLK